MARNWQNRNDNVYHPASVFFVIYFKSPTVLVQTTHMRTLKVLLIGSGGVGKSSFATRFTNDYFTEETDPTIDEIYTKEFKVDNESYKIDIHDIGHNNVGIWYQPWATYVDSLLLIYDITSRSSFEEIQFYIQQIEKEEKETPMVIVANKCDLESARKITTSEGISLAETLKCPLYEASAKLNINVEETFCQLIREIHKHERANFNNNNNNNNNNRDDNHKPCSLQ
jgi:GTPase KRas